ncbi:MAG: hypothetical protein ABIG84_03315 [archaeon]
MTEAAIPEKIADELAAIRQDLDYIKKHMVDVDSIMTEDDYIALQEYRKEKKSGKLVLHEQVKRELVL